MRSTLRCHVNLVLSKHAQTLIAQLPFAPLREEVRPTYAEPEREISFRGVTIEVSATQLHVSNARVSASRLCLGNAEAGINTMPDN